MKLDLTETVLYMLSNNGGIIYLSRVTASDGTEKWSRKVLKLTAKDKYHY